MARFDRYLLSQLMMLFGFFALVLVMVYWVNRAVVLFDQLIADGHSAGVFVEFTALTLPNVIRIVLPVAAFAASVYVANRLSSESELVVVQATGFSAHRMVRPVFTFGLIVAGLLSILTHLLVPASVTQLRERQAELTQNVTARLLTEGTFLHPADGITFYIREITPRGELLDIFLSDARDPRERVTYTARQALLIRQEDGPKLVMLDGMAQALETAEDRLAVTSFEDFAFDMGALIQAADLGRRSGKELTTPELIRPTAALAAETGQSRAALMYEGHNRFNQALLTVVAAVVGFAVLLVGRFRRFGYWRQIVGAVVLLILLKSLDNAFADAARNDPLLWPLAYASTLIGLALALALLWLAERPGLFRRRAARGAAA